MIKEKRISRNYTQEKMAKLLGISLRQYVRIDNEEDLPRRDVLYNLIIELELTDEEIGKYIRKMTKTTYNNTTYKIPWKRWTKTLGEQYWNW